MTVRLIVHCLPVVLLLAGSVSPVGAQNANDGPTGKIRELNETPVAEASKHIGDLVMMKGSTSRYKPDPTNASVYDLKDQYGDTLSVRGSNRQMALDQIYVVVGTLAKRSDGKPELIEIKRLAPKANKGQPEPTLLWDTETNEPVEATSSDKDETKADDPEDGDNSQNLLLYGIGAGLLLIAIALGVILTIGSNARRQEELRKAQEKEAEARRRELARVVAARDPRHESIPAGKTQLAPSPCATLEAWGTLKVVEGPDAGLTFPLAGREIRIGRAEGDVVLAKDQAVSSTHGKIVQANDGRLLYTDESKNGSVVSGKPVHRGRSELTDGAEIQVGVSKLLVTVIPREKKPAPSAMPTTAISVAEKATELFTGCELTVVDGDGAGRKHP